jgi:predicted nucleic acid-binding protein
LAEYPTIFPEGDMRILLDTNIFIHREAAAVVNTDIGYLFRWMDKLGFEKCVHPVSVSELLSHGDAKIRDTLAAKLGAYNVLKTTAPIAPQVSAISAQIDTNQYDINDTQILNELFCGRVDYLLTEDKKLRAKGKTLGLENKLFSVDSFLEKVTGENPEFANYDVLSIRKDYFGNIDVNDDFFSSLRNDYPGFVQWFNRKADESAYICKSENRIRAFLYLKVETENEPYPNIMPVFAPKRRMKVGTFKVAMNGFRLGERFMKVLFDNAIAQKVDEVYVTVFNRTLDQQRLMNLLEEFGFQYHGTKGQGNAQELVYVKSMQKYFNPAEPKLTMPYFSLSSDTYLVSIYPEYHTELFPDSILRTESPEDFVENQPHRNAISKVYISRSFFRDLKRGDNIVFYRTGGYYRGVVTTIGIVENVVVQIPDEKTFIDVCRKRSVFSDSKLAEHWNYESYSRPFVVNFLYCCSFPKRINLARLIELGIIADTKSAPRGFEKISSSQFETIVRECKVDESTFVN